MSKSIMYWVQGYRPENEAVSKEIRYLYNYFENSSMHDLNIKPLKFSFKKYYISYYYKLIPLGLVTIPILSRFYNISHIFTSTGDLPYLTLLSKKPIILTAALSAPIPKIKKQIKHYNKLAKVVVESEKDRQILIDLGVDKKKITKIYPGIELDKFTYNKPNNEKFTILFASSPPHEDMFESTGTNLLLDVAKVLEKEVDFIFLWREVGYDKVRKIIEKRGIKNVHTINGTIEDMNKMYAVVDATIAAPKVYHEFKPIPNSIIESLAAGKPALVSNISGISEVISEENCGVIFDPNYSGDVILKIRELKNKYNDYQKNCRKTAEKHFSLKTFLNKYEGLYNNV